MKTYAEIFEACFGGPYETGAAAREAAMAELTPAERATWYVIRDLSDRRGLAQEWDQIDADIKDQIFATLRDIIARETVGPMNVHTEEPDGE